MNAKLNNQQGAALLAVLVVSTVLALVGTSYLSTSTHEAGLVTEQIHEVQALYAAESGIEYARQRLKSGDEWTTPGSWTTTINTPQVNGVGGTVTVAFNYTDVDGDSNLNSGDIGIITSTSTFQGHQKQLVLNVSPINNTPFQQASCGCASVNLNGAAGVDSYDGSVMTYEDPANPATSNGDVASNGDVDLGGATILGDVIAGGNLSGSGSSAVSGDATLGGTSSLADPDSQIGGNLTENVTPAPSPCDCNAIDVDAEVAQAAASNNNASIDPAYLDDGSEFEMSSGSVTLTAGTYYFTEFEVTGGTLNISGQVIIFFSGAGEFKFAGNATYNSSDNTNNLRIYSNSTADIDLRGSTKFSGLIYAPNASISLGGNTEFHGALVGNVSIMSGSVGLHYDTSIPAQGEPDEIDVNITLHNNSWSQN